MKMNRGNLASGVIADVNAEYSQAWAEWNGVGEVWETRLGGLGNWSSFKVDEDGGGEEDSGWTLSQTRTHNAVNEITGISENPGDSWIDPIYDARGDNDGEKCVNARSESVRIDKAEGPLAALGRPAGTCGL